MLDIHSHILPHMDDGSGSTAETLAMLEASWSQGIRMMAATPHFYAEENSPEKFLQRREAAARRLTEAWHPGLPRVLLGAEVCYFEGVSRIEQADSLKIEGTPLLLLEMPFTPWSGRTLAEVKELSGRPGTVVVLAHIERYLQWQSPETWNTLRDAGVLFQCNAGFFLRWNTRRKALRMLREGRIHFLGSDCHNMKTRPPRLGEAMERIGQPERRTLRIYEQKYFSSREE